MGKENMQNKKPMILVLAGPNGSGKSTITAFFDKVGKYTNADDVVAATGMDNMEAAIPFMCFGLLIPKKTEHEDQ